MDGNPIEKTTISHRKQSQFPIMISSWSWSLEQGTNTFFHYPTHSEKQKLEFFHSNAYLRYTDSMKFPLQTVLSLSDSLCLQ